MDKPFGYFLGNPLGFDMAATYTTTIPATSWP